jgi:hypothetical protein
MTGLSMRTLIVIAAMSLLATQAYAGGSRSLSLAAANANQQAAGSTTQTPATTTTTQTLATTTQPTVTSTTTPAATTPAPQSTAPAKTTAATKPKPREPSAEARVIRELHRHGIYW